MVWIPPISVIIFDFKEDGDDKSWDGMGYAGATPL
jgi:hypothetical protein